MKKLVLLVLIVMPFFVRASHIVGGEFELRHIAASQYQLTMILYFDKVHGSPGAKDRQVRVSIFRTSDNARMMDVTLPLTDSVWVDYSDPSCSDARLKTMKYFYRSTITLASAIFNHPQGYYISWQRCCRNYSIDNIYSDDPGTVNPDPAAEGIYAGQTFYLEFPPVVKNGVPFIDSTPELFPPLSDYARVGMPYYVFFGGTDVDGDSLAYSLVTPLNTLTPNPLPPPDGLPKPKDPLLGRYPEVTWRPDYSLTHVMGGNPDLAISDDGWLTVTPSVFTNDELLYVFAVRCEEFRNGEKIGETRRDFQMLVLPAIVSSPPVIKGRRVGENTFGYVDQMNITFAPLTPDSERCIEVEVSDPDIFNELDNFTEKVKIRTKGKSKNLEKVTLPSIKVATLNQTNQTATFKICLDECPVEPNVPYQFTIVASDDACALPWLDELLVTVNVQIPQNTAAHFVEPTDDVVFTLDEGHYKDWPVKVVDDDGDKLNLSYSTDGFALNNVGMDFDFNQPVQGIIEDTLIWLPLCNKYDFSVKRDFKITMIADDDDFCGFNKPDTAYFNLTMQPPPNSDPIIYSELNSGDKTKRFVDAGFRKIYDAFTFNVFGEDADAEYPIELSARGVGFQLIDKNMTFPTVKDKSPISSTFNWPLICDVFDLKKQNAFIVEFIVIDNSNWCKIYQADTLDVAFHILPPDNLLPEISAENLHPETSLGENRASSFTGNPIEFMLTGTDDSVNPVVDNLKLELIGATGNVTPTGYSFNDVTGKTKIQSKFTWNPDCSVFVNENFSNTYKFLFRVTDDHCESEALDTLTLHLNVKDYISTDENFDPLNVITPNGDGKNDFFALDGYELRFDESGSTIDPNEFINLPLDNCINKFEYINIYNRWGKLMFTSKNRYFKWYPDEVAAGDYYYLLKFTNAEYKGFVEVRY